MYFGEGLHYSFCLSCAGQAALRIIKGMFTKTTTIHETRERIRSLIRIASNRLCKTLFATSNFNEDVFVDANICTGI